LLRRGVLFQFFINRAECIDCDYYDIDYKIRCYIPFKGTRRLAGSSKNSIYNFNRLITRENILLDLFTEISEKSKNRFLNMKSREIPIPSDSDREFFFKNRLQSSLIDTGKENSIMAVLKFILSFSGIFGISHFIEIGITNFFINYRDMCKNYNIKEKKRIRRCSRYCAEHIVIIIRGLVFFIEPD
jgi:hypothetical protein